MNIEIFRDYCIAKPGVTEGFPFDETTLVFKVMDKMFALTDLDGDLSVNLKCNLEKAVLTDRRKLYLYFVFKKSEIVT